MKIKDRIILWYNKYCYKHKIDSDLFDIDAEIDSSISFEENVNILEEKINGLAESGTFLSEQIKKEKARMEQEFKESKRVQEFSLSKLFDKPKIIGICSDVNEGKSMTLYYLIKFLKENFNFKMFSYGLRVNTGEQKIYSIEELEKISNSVVILDEFFTLLDLDDRKKRKAIENTIRLIHHNNNILILAGVPENFKKFISAKLSIMFFKRITLGDFINGSRIKNICTNYNGIEMGSSVLNMRIDECLVFDGKHYSKINIPYLKDKDTKLQNVGICVPLNVQKKCIK